MTLSSQISHGPPDTVLPSEPQDRLDALERVGATQDRDEAARIVSDAPRSLMGWATLGELTELGIDRYAAFRVGYHRGLDTLRQNGWRGSGYVRWEHPSNRGFLRCLAGLAEAAAHIGESDEAERCEVFLEQLDPRRFQTSR